MPAHGQGGLVGGAGNGAIDAGKAPAVPLLMPLPDPGQLPGFSHDSSELPGVIACSDQPLPAPVPPPLSFSGDSLPLELDQMRPERVASAGVKAGIDLRVHEIG